MSQHPRVGLLAELEFREGSTMLPDAFGSQLGRVAAWANDNFDGLVIIDGHADARGPDKGNVRLSLQRAQLVRDHLIAVGVDPSQLIVTAFGPDRGRRPRVVVWGTRNSLQEVTGALRGAREIQLPGGRTLEVEPPREARR
jgi:hypothetical protein